MKALQELDIPAGLRYAPGHEWIATGEPWRVGISDFAQDQLGDLTFVELPEIGRVVKLGEEIGTLESIKSVSSLFSPVGGKVRAVNPNLQDDPGLVNREPYGRGWLVEVVPADPEELTGLRDDKAYREYLKKESHG
ncbi:MAG: glycine cleavage system protein GcvH [Planctomycetota bacterium]|nr:glycine cleavage system protein GcvH [Planctomycetota bacterium]